MGMGEQGSSNIGEKLSIASVVAAIASGITSAVVTTLVISGYIASPLVIGTTPITADADADCIVQSTAATQVPLVVQGFTAQSDNLFEAKGSTGSNLFYLYSSGGWYSSGNSWSNGLLSVSNWMQLGSGIQVGLNGPSDSILSVIGKTGGSVGDNLASGLYLHGSGRIYGNAVAAIGANAGNKRACSGSNVVTMTTYQAHHFVAGQTITIASCGDATYNGTYIIASAPSATTFTFALTHALEAETADAAVTMTISAQLVLGGAPVTADADADVLIQSTAAGQVPLVVQGAAGQTDNVFQTSDSNGAREFRIAPGGACDGPSYTASSTYAYMGVNQFGTTSVGKFTWGSGATDYATPDLSLSRKDKNILGIGDGVTSDAIRVGASGRIYSYSVADPVPSVTKADHTSDGYSVTIKAIGHNLCSGQTVILSGWVWNDGGGDVNRTSAVEVLTADTFTMWPTVPPTTGTNPSTVGTVTVSPQLQLGGIPTNPTANVDVCVSSTQTTQIPLVVNTMSGQTTDFQQWQNQGSVKAFIDQYGEMYSGGFTLWSPSSGTQVTINNYGGAFHTDDQAGEDIYFQARDGDVGIAYDVPLSTTAGDHTSDGTYLKFTTQAAHGLVSQQSVTISGFTDSGFNGTFVIVNVPTPTTFWVSKAGSFTCTVVGTCAAMPARAGGNIILQPGIPTQGGATGTVQCPGPATGSTLIGVQSTWCQVGPDSVTIGSYARAWSENSIAIGAYACSGDGVTDYQECLAIGANSTVDGTYGTGVGPYTDVDGAEATALGIGAVARLDHTVNITGVDIVQKSDAYKWNVLGNNCSRPTIIYGEPVTVLATSTVTQTMPTGCHVYIEECGVVCSTLTLNGGTLTTQPTLSFGITGTNAKHRAAEITTLLTASHTRERYTTLLTDVGETSLTMTITVAATITGGTSPVYKVRPYWVVRAVEDE